MFLDLDGFKSINDRLGHDAGDRLLIEMAARLQSSLRATDTAARFAGDEFLVLVEGLDDHQEIERLAARISRALATSFRLETEEAHVSATVGLAVTGDPDSDPADLIQTADEAMLRNKARRARPSVDEPVRSGPRLAL